MSTVAARRTIPSLLVIAGSVLIAPTPAIAGGNHGHQCKPTPYTAQAEATLLRVGVLNGKVLDAQIAKARSEVNSTRKLAAQAKAEYADAKLLSTSVLPRAVAEQAAPPNHEHPDVAKVADINLPGVVKATIGQSEAATATARWKPQYACGEAAAISKAETAVASAEVLSLLRVNSLATSKTSIQTVELRRNTVGVQAMASTGITDILILNKLKVKVLHQPVLKVTAGKNKAEAVHYEAPLLEVSGLPGGKTQQISVDQPVLDVDLGGLGLVKLSLGELKSDINEHKCKVKAQAATLRVQVKLLNKSIADVELGQIETSADGEPYHSAMPAQQNPPITQTVDQQPQTQEQPAESPTPIINVSNQTPSSLPVTGMKLAGIIVGGIALLVGGILLLQLVRRRRTTFQA